MGQCTAPTDRVAIVSDIERLAEAFDHRLYPKEWVAAQIENGNFRILRGDASAILFDVIIYPSGVAELRGLAAFGDPKEIVKILIPQAEQWAFENNIARCSISSRSAWRRLLPDYHLYKTTIVKDL